MKLKQRCFIGYQPGTRETRASNATPPPPPDTGSNAVKPSPELKIILDMTRGKRQKYFAMGQKRLEDEKRVLRLI